MNPVQLKPSEYFKSLQIIHLGLMAGVGMFALVTFILHSTGNLEAEAAELDAVLRYVVPVFAIGGILAGNLLFSQRLKACLQQPGLKGKLEFYQSALIIKYASVEGSAFFSIVAFMLTGNLIYLGMAGLLLIVLLVNRPTREKAITHLELDHQERELINDPNTVI